MPPSTSTVTSFTDSRILPPINTTNLSSPIRSYQLQTRGSQPIPPDSFLPPMDSYFPSTQSNPSSTSSTPAPIEPSSLKQHQAPRRSTRNSKKPSISSLLSDSSGDSSPSGQWSAASSPTTTASGGTRSSSVSTSTTPLSGYNTGYEIGLVRRRSSLSQIGSPMCDLDRLDGLNGPKVDSDAMNGSKQRKARSSPRTGVNNGNTDEYDVLGRKKPKTPRTPMSWDPQDDILLKSLKEEQRLGWKEIATHFPGRTSHACQFRWRRLASGTLKYYQGHRRPPVVTTTSTSFANEMATATTGTASGSPKILMRGVGNISPAPSTNPNTPQMHHTMPHYSPIAAESPLRPHSAFYSLPPSTPWASSAPFQMALYQTSPLPSPPSCPSRYIMEEPMMEPWTSSENALLLDKKRSFDEVNVLLPKRSEKEIWDRMTKLRSQVGPESLRRRHTADESMRLPAMGIRRNNTWER
ncbi:hypothetical protein C7212DRAFT_363190 [Tuber magnatum]|uniref:Uncharacterized protein n=1 Tax=Tuber magnatum TaxID=42249 RepID=A0A317SS96_9PEZI|nr:hypothetical protein C7212DRAFT_363190 [Tuber magnatum]